MTFEPRTGPAAQVLIPSALTAIVVSGLLGWLAATGPVGPGTFIYLVLTLVVLILGLATLLYAFIFRSLTYHLDRNGLLIHAGGWRITVPMDSITGTYAVPTGARRSRFRGLRIPGHNVGVERTADGITLVSVATAAPEECLYVRAGRRAYAISPEDPEAFRRTYQMEHALGPLRPIEHVFEPPPLLRYLFWRDQVGRTLVPVAIIGMFALLAMAFWRYPNLPDQIPMHFDAAGLPDRWAPPSNIFYLPVAGATVLVVNSLLGTWIYSREKVLSYFLWSGAAVVQLVLILTLRAIAA